jgi:single-strand DNA-binding protein
MNKILLIGTMGRDAEVRQVGDKKVAQFSLATSKKYKDHSGQLKEDTQWHKIVLWGNEGVYPYLVKGQLLYVEGEINYREYQNKEGVTMQITEVRASSVQLLGGKKGQPTQAESTHADDVPQENNAPFPDDLPFN